MMELGWHGIKLTKKMKSKSKMTMTVLAQTNLNLTKKVMIKAILRAITKMKMVVAQAVVVKSKN